MHPVSKLEVDSRAMANPALGLFKKDREPKSFSEVRPLASDEYANYQRNASILIQWQNDQDRPKAVLAAFVEYMDTVSFYEDELGVPRHIDGPTAKRELNIRLSNYLHALRSFLDQSDKALSDRHGKMSFQRERFKVATSEVYDGSFSYRLLDQVRNYTQHVGEAIESVTYGWKALDRQAQTSEPYLDVLFDRDRFLKWKQLKSSFQKELKEQPEKIQVTPHVREVTGCITYLDEIFVAQHIDDLVEAAKHIVALTAPLQDQDGIPCVMHFDPPNVEVGQRGNFNLRMDWIPMEIAEFVLAAHEQASGSSATEPPKT